MKVTRTLEFDLDDIRDMVIAYTAAHDKSIFDEEQADRISSKLDLFLQMMSDMVEEELADQMQENAVREYGEL
jgi:hypothetical protein